MRTLKRFAAIILVIAALCPVLAFYSSAADDIDTVFFPIWDGECDIYTPFEVKGTVSLGDNTASKDDGSCWSFNAEETGYYFINCGCCYEIDSLRDNNLAEWVFSNDMSGAFSDGVKDGDDYYSIFYIEKAGTYYFRFYTYSYNSTPEPDSCLVSLVFAGDLVSLGYDKDPLYMGVDFLVEDSGYNFLEGAESVRCYDGNAEMLIEFSTGKICTSDSVYGIIDKWEAGKRNFKVDLSNGPEYDLEINLVRFSDSVEEAVLPDSFTPEATYHFSGNIYETHDTTYSYPEYVEIHFKDGSVKKVDMYFGKTWLECSDEFTFEGAKHYVETEYRFLNSESRTFCVMVDGFCIYEAPVKNKSSLVSDFKVYLSGMKQCLQSLRIGSLTDTFKNVAVVSDSMRSLTKQYLDYISFIRKNGIALI